MKKIMFNDKYGLTQAVLNGQKTMTRRVIKLTPSDKEYLETAFDYDLREMVILDRYSHYQNGEVVAIAQSYYDIEDDNYRKNIDEQIKRNPRLKRVFIYNGHLNKMYVRAKHMPHHIRITNIRIERLQDISDADCIKEGVSTAETPDGLLYYTDASSQAYSTPQQAFAVLIDKVGSRGTWESNPYVAVYSFILAD